MEENIKTEVKNKSTMGVAALVLGIISIVTALFWYISMPTGIIAIVFGAKSSKKAGSKLGKAGMITGIVGVSVLAFLYISIILILLLASI